MNDPAPNPSTQRTVLNWGLHAPFNEREFIDYFFLMYSKNMSDDTVLQTNNNLVNAGKSGYSYGEHLKYLGLRLGTAIQRRRGPLHEAYWGTDSSKETFLGGTNFQKLFGMSFQRFKDITSSLQLCAKPNTLEVIY